MIETSESDLKKLLDEQSAEISSLKRNYEKLKTELSEELSMARAIQTSLLPKELPTFVNIDIASIYIPANKVGGDLYDIVITMKQKVAILIFDVSGHGIPAALIGAMAKMIFLQLIEKYDSPARVFKEINFVLCEYLNTENYLTAFLGILDPIQNHMVFSRAGHVKPLIVKKYTNEISELDAKGFFIGHSALKDIARYSEDEIYFDPGDRLLLYTDGLTEGSNNHNVMFGTERLKASVQKNRILSPDDFLGAILSEQTEFLNGVPLRDDFTMLVVDIKDSSHLLNDSGFERIDNPERLMITEKSEIEDACSLILREMDNFGFTDKEIKRFKVCFFEMAINSIDHGNQNSSDKQVVIFYKVNDSSVSVSFIDEGVGFDYNNLPNPLKKLNLLKENGRGVFIARRYADKVIFNKAGNRVFLEMGHRGSS